MKMNTYVCNGRFQGNIIVMERIFCGKTYLFQKLATNNFFGE